MALTPNGYRPRFIDSEIESYLGTFGAVSIEGPRWCGKTWSSLNHCNSAIRLDDGNIPVLETDRSYALAGEEPRLIDEWQALPQLWDDVRFEVDRTTRKGRYVLCGSSTPNRERTMHSGAGRIGTLSMHTMSLFESGDSDGSASLRSLFDGGFRSTPLLKKSLDELIRLTYRGGWPGLVSNDSDPGRANRDYLRKICGGDASRIDGKRRDAHRMMMLIRSLARNESTVVSDATIARDMKEYDGESISPVTLADYRSVLERLYILGYQPAYSPNVRSPIRVGKSPKRHLADPSLSMAALGLTPEKALKDLEAYGFMFEAMCERDLRIYAEADGGSLYHYRDSYGNEIDAVVEMPDGRWGAFEIKLGEHQIDEAAEGLLKMESLIEADGPSVLCVVCGMAQAAYRREDGVYVVPITSLRNRRGIVKNPAAGAASPPSGPAAPTAPSGDAGHPTASPARTSPRARRLVIRIFRIGFDPKFRACK